MVGQSFYWWRMSVRTGRSPQYGLSPHQAPLNWQTIGRAARGNQSPQKMGGCHGSATGAPRGLCRHGRVGKVPGVWCVSHVWFRPFYSLYSYFFPAELLPSTLIRTSGLLSYKSCLVGAGQGHHGSLWHLVHVLLMLGLYCVSGNGILCTIPGVHHQCLLVQ